VEASVSRVFPGSSVSAGRLWTELADGRPLASLWTGNRLALLVAGAGVLGCLALGLNTARSAPPWFAKLHTRSLQRPALEYLTERAAADDLIYHNFWSDFAVLYHYRPQGRYVVALDPVFMYRKDPERFRLMLEGYRGRAHDLHAIVADEFGARWIFISHFPAMAPFGLLVRRDPRFERVYSDMYSEIYEVK
jgi:hypothetical protein